jgi:SpoVK/Ycf46/Vps4 family AAA+-type ATPase
LLQRIENYGGLVIVASNLRKNMDEAFSRRFELIVHFAIPDPQLRREYWEANVPEGLPFAANVNLDMLARHELTIASIDNVINRACVLSLQAGVMQISSEVLGRCIRDENFK